MLRPHLIAWIGAWKTEKKKKKKHYQYQVSSLPMILSLNKKFHKNANP